MSQPLKRSFRGHRTPRGLERPEVLVIGLGRFGSALATALIEEGHDVLGVDESAVRVQDHAEALTRTLQADCTSESSLRRIGAADMSTAVVCIGNNIESSVLATAALVDIGVTNIWAKAITEAHGNILRRVGAHHVVFPEADMGRRVAHLLTGQLMEYIALDDEFVLVELSVPQSLVGVTLGHSDIRAKFRVTVVCVKPHDQPFTYATSDTVLGADDLVVLAGLRQDIDEFIAAMGTRH